MNAAEVERERRLLRAVFDGALDATLVADDDGRYVDANAAACLLFGVSKEQLIGRTLADFELLLLRPDGARRELEHSAVANVLPGLHLSVLRDLGERRRVEAKLRHSEAQLRQEQKMDAIGDLAGGVAHDFNNFLAIILTYSKMLLAELPAEDRLVPDLEQIDKAAERAARLTKQLLAFSRQQILEPQVLDLNHLARGLEEVLGRLLGGQIRLSLLQGPNLQRICADPAQLEQVLIHLVMNARDAMPDGGSLTLETANVELDGASPEQHLGVPPGSYVMVAVTDTGVGMDAKTAARIFEPFFSTKAKDKGTGLGLSTVYGIVRQSNGYVWTHSEPGVGTTFKVYFPTADLNVQPSVTTTASIMLDGTETILLATDV